MKLFSYFYKKKTSYFLAIFPKYFLNKMPLNKGEFGQYHKYKYFNENESYFYFSLPKSICYI